jgi:plasmid segregation protein ParM
MGWGVVRAIFVKLSKNLGGFAVARKKAVVSEVVVGLDIGYGQVKAVASGVDPVIFPSVWGRKSDSSFQTTQTEVGYTGDDLEDDEGAWLIGDKAVKHVAPASLRNLRGRTADESQYAHIARLRLAKAAFGKLFSDLKDGDVLHVRLATGLPVDHMDGAEELKAQLLGQHKVSTDQADFVVNVVECFVMPQPYGTIYQQMIQSDGQLDIGYTYERTGVCDVGTFTIDAALDDDGEYIAPQSGSFEAGIHMVQRRIAEEYERLFKQKPSAKDVEMGVKTGYIKVRGQHEDFTEVRNSAVRDLSEAALNLANQVWQAGANIDVIFVTGGGAQLVYEAIQRQYPQAVLADNAEIANAQGYLNFALNRILEG